MRTMVLNLVVLVALIVASAAQAEPKQHSRTCPTVREGITFYKQATWRWQALRGVPKTEASKQRIHPTACAYQRQVAKLWQSRAAKARDRYKVWAEWHVIPATYDWVTAVKLVQRIYPGTEDWLMFISDREGGHGACVMNHEGSGAGCWMQFMESTYWTYSYDAYRNAQRRGFLLQTSTNSWKNPLGQALTAGYMRFTGRDGCHWCL